MENTSCHRIHIQAIHTFSSENRKLFILFAGIQRIVQPTDFIRNQILQYHAIRVDVTCTGLCDRCGADAFGIFQRQRQRVLIVVSVRKNETVHLDARNETRKKSILTFSYQN